MSKSQKVIAEFKTGRKLTSREVWYEFNHSRLAVIIERYRKKHGFNSIITHKLTVNGDTFANYEMI